MSNDTLMIGISEDDLKALEYKLERAQMLQKNTEEQANAYLQEVFKAQDEIASLKESIQNSYVPRFLYDTLKASCDALKEQNRTICKEITYLKLPRWERAFNKLLGNDLKQEDVSVMVVRMQKQYNQK
jgi:hypothetical protein